MASPTKKHKIRKRLKKAAAGKDRKNEARRDGTTPRGLPLTTPNANEAKQAKAKV